MTRYGKWFAYVQPRRAARIRLFCLPYAGASAVIYRDWPQYLPEEIEFYPVELPGRGKRRVEPLATNLRLLADEIAVALVSYLDLPFAIFGHSMGALAAFELARSLRRKWHVEPVHLFVGGRGSPDTVPEKEQLHLLPEPEFRAALRHLNGTDDELLESDDAMEFFSPIIRADFRLVHEYTFATEVPLGCDITAFTGLDDSGTRMEDMQLWRRHTNGSFALHCIQGDHFFVKSNLSEVLAVISNELSMSARR